MDDLIDAWISGKQGYLKLAQKLLDKTHTPLYEALLLLHENRYRFEKHEETIQFANSVPLQNCPLNYVILFYLEWAHLDQAGNRIDEARLILDQAESLLVKSTPPEVQAKLLFLRGLLSDSPRACESLYVKGLSLLTKKTPVFYSSISQVADFYSRQGKLIDMDEDLFKHVSKVVKDKFLFVNAVETGNRDHMEKYRAAALQNEANVPKPYWETLQDLSLLVDILQGKAIQQDAHYWLLSTKALLDGDQSLALVHAKKFKEISVGKFGRSTNFNFYTLLRAELAGGNAKAGRLLVENQKSGFERHFLSHFFSARIELIAGNTEKALLHFRKVQGKCRKYNALGRLDIELDLSLELNARHMRLLLQDVPQERKSAPSKVVASAGGSAKHKQTGVRRLMGVSKVMSTVRKDILKYARLDIPVLITGETGVGKDVMAHAIHEESDRRREPFIAINCGAIAESLLQSELFGHEAGAYTGATKAHQGLFEAARGGTLFLDEIGDISPAIQIALLRILESGEFRSVGSTKSRPYHCRIVTATNAPLESRVEEGLFRVDLLYRLKRLTLHIPPLRERTEDIEILAEHFLNTGNSEEDWSSFSPELKSALLRHRWPGNVRELKNEIEKMRLLNSDKSYYEIEDAKFLPLSAPVFAERVLPSTKKESESPLPASPEGNIGDIVQQVLQNSHAQFRRIDKIKALFREHKRFTRQEICQITGVTTQTAGNDLKTLIAEGFIRKVEPTRSPRTHYFCLAD